MRIIGVDFHVRQQTIAMFDTETKELVKKMLKHDGEEVREFYSGLPRPVQVGNRGHRIDVLVSRTHG